MAALTYITVAFVSESVISITNTLATTISVEISKLLTTGVFDTPVVLTLTDSEVEQYDFGDDTGIFKIYDGTFDDANTIIVIGTVVDALEDDVKEILLADDIQKILPKGYDFVTLALLSLIYIGNSPYQNAEYLVANLTKYTSIAIAIDRCEKYLDRIDNTPQSSNKLWQ